jgi:hypothetical protein
MAVGSAGLPALILRSEPIMSSVPFESDNWPSRATQLSAVGRAVVFVLGDGNCALYSVACVLAKPGGGSTSGGAYLNPAANRELREAAYRVMKRLHRSWKALCDFAPAGDGRDTDWQWHIAKDTCRREGRWFGCPQLRALAIALGRDIVVVTPREPARIYYSDERWVDYSCVPGAADFGTLEPSHLEHTVESLADLVRWMRDGTPAPGTINPPPAKAFDEPIIICYDGGSHYDATRLVTEARALPLLDFPALKDVTPEKLKLVERAASEALQAAKATDQSGRELMRTVYKATKAECGKVKLSCAPCFLCGQTTRYYNTLLAHWCHGDGKCAKAWATHAVS